MVCGIDEAGRGCLCGSLFVCGVLGDELSLAHLGIQDSKKLSESMREHIALELYELSKTGSIMFHIVEKSAQDIDSQGLSLCLKNSLQEIIQTFLPRFKDTEEEIYEFIFDGNTTFGLQIQKPSILRTLIKGDSKHLLIGAASILAKVAKDSQMREIDRIYPQYGLKSNKGYGTKAHTQAILEYGYTPFHRKSFTFTPRLKL